jgi:Na+/H+ antiporter NhaA
MSSLFITIAILAALIAGFAIGRLYAEMQHMRERIVTLEQAQAKHLPYRTADAIEDATAALNSLQFELDFKRDLLDNAISHLKQAREGRKP